MTDVLRAVLHRLVSCVVVLILIGLTACERQERPADPAVPADPRAEIYSLRNLGKLHADRDTVEGYLEAAEVYARLVELSPDDFLDRLNFARVLVYVRDPEDRAAEAGPHLERARELLPGAAARVPLDYVTGIFHKRVGDHAASIEPFARVTQAQPDLLQGWYQLGYAYEQTKELARAEATYREALKRAPQYRPYAYRLALVLREQRRPEARAAARAASELPKDHEDTEKCPLVRVERRRPYDRADAEPPRVALEWRDIGSVLGVDASTTGVKRLLPFDADEDGDLDLLEVTGDGVTLLRHDGSVLQRQPLAAPISGAYEAAIGDLDNDGLDDVVVAATSGLVFLHARAADTGPTFVASTPFPSVDGPVDLALFDVDHDADLDVVVLGPHVPSILRNNGDLTFIALAPFAGAGGPGDAAGGLDAHDLDQANDLDLVFPGPPVTAYLNLRDGTFQDVPLPKLGVRTHVLSDDLDNDGAPDLFCWGGDPGYAMAFCSDRSGRTREYRISEPIVQPAPACGAIHDATFADVDNDGDLDVLLAAEAGLTVLRNGQGGTLEEEPVVAFDGADAPVKVETADLDLDGALEAIVVTRSGAVRVLSPGKPRYFSWRLRPRGAADNRRGVGTVVEQFAGKLYQSVMMKGPNGLHLGAGVPEMAGIDGVRMRWPAGILQSLDLGDLEPEKNRTVEFQQKEGKLVSCPFLYTRRPDGWTFVTDVIGIAPLDEWLPPGKTPHRDAEEYVRVPGEVLAPIDGTLHIAVTEELKETTYLDRVELIVVDHPGTREVYLDETSRQGEYDPLRIHLIEPGQVSVPAAVEVEEVPDALERTRRRDGLFLHAYPEAPSQWSGWVPRHGIDLTLGARTTALLLNGRVAWYDSTVAYALAQHGRGWSAPVLERVHPDGRTEVLIPDIGVPAGLDRTMVVPVPAQDAGTRLRITSQYTVLWDAFQTVEAMTTVELPGGTGRVTTDGGDVLYRTLPVRSAELGYHGFSQTLGNVARHEQTYRFEETAPDDLFGRARGRATRYGDVTDLLGEHDDRLVVLVAGDRVALEFDAPPAGPAGTTRTYVVRVSGWAKEAGFHNRTGEAIDPLPFRSMTRYPPPPSEISDRQEDAAYREYLREYQTRIVRW